MKLEPGLRNPMTLNGDIKLDVPLHLRALLRRQEEETRQLELAGSQYSLLVL
jgi:hypothetical protein